eukprot:747555-Hanusia_phi.AAC.2
MTSGFRDSSWARGGGRWRWGKTPVLHTTHPLHHQRSAFGVIRTHDNGFVTALAPGFRRAPAGPGMPPRDRMS